MKLDVMLALEEEKGCISLNHVQELKFADRGARVQFAGRQLDFTAANQNYANKILWTDESIFCVRRRQQIGVRPK